MGPHSVHTHAHRRGEAAWTWQGWCCPRDTAPTVLGSGLTEADLGSSLTSATEMAWAAWGRRGAFPGGVMGAAQDSLQLWEKQIVQTHTPCRARSVSPAAPQWPCEGSAETKAAGKFLSMPMRSTPMGALAGPLGPQISTTHFLTVMTSQTVVGQLRSSDWPERGAWLPAQILRPPRRPAPGGQGINVRVPAASQPLGQRHHNAGI